MLCLAFLVILPGQPTNVSCRDIVLVGLSLTSWLVSRMVWLCDGQSIREVSRAVGSQVLLLALTLSCNDSGQVCVCVTTCIICF